MVRGLAGPICRPLWEAIRLVYIRICKDSEGSRERGLKWYADLLGLYAGPYEKR